MNLDQTLSVKLFYLAAAFPWLSALSWFCASVLIFILLAAAVLSLGWPKFYEKRNQLLELLLAAAGSWSQCAPGISGWWLPLDRGRGGARRARCWPVRWPF